VGIAWLEDIAQGAALVMQSQSFFAPDHGMYDLLLHGPLAEPMQSYLEAVGVPKYTD
jgi:hypothetical protein